MPKRLNLKTILIIGSGPIVIGQGCEFDYSGVQACKALRREGYRIVLINSNPATIMTDPDFADATYVEPLTPEYVRLVIQAERPDALLPTMGGQTALNLAMELARNGTLDEFGVELIGARAESIAVAEDRQLFKDAMLEIGFAVPRSEIVMQTDAALRAAEKNRLPGAGAAIVHIGRQRRRNRGHAGSTAGDRGQRVEPVACPFSADRTIGRRLERIRTRSHARSQG